MKATFGPWVRLRSSSHSSWLATAFFPLVRQPFCCHLAIQPFVEAVADVLRVRADLDVHAVDVGELAQVGQSLDHGLHFHRLLVVLGSCPCTRMSPCRVSG